MPSAHTRGLKRYSPCRIFKREMANPKTHMLSGRTANGALAEAEIDRIYRVQAIPTLILYSRKLLSGSSLGITTVEDRQSRSASLIRLIKIPQFSSYPNIISGRRTQARDQKGGNTGPPIDEMWNVPLYVRFSLHYLSHQRRR